MKRILPIAFAAAAVSIAAACGSGAGGTNSGTSPTPTPTGTATPAGTPDFQADIVPIFTASCGASDNSCHSRAAYAATASQECRGWLALEDTSLGSVVYAGPSAGTSTGCPDVDLYDRLTKLAAWECDSPQMAYVTTDGNLSKSYLYAKITGGPYCVPAGGGASSPMPLSGSLSATDIDLIRRWIQAGAPR